MRILHLIIAFFALLQIKTSSAQSLSWAGQFSGTGSKIIEGSAVDANGNYYTIGGFQDVVDFDPGPGVMNLTAPGFGGMDVFISKQSTNGNTVWVKQIGGSQIDVARVITVHNGFIEVAGDFRGTVDLDPGPGVLNATAGPNGDAFIIRLANDGTFISARIITTTAGSSVSVRGAARDLAGNTIYVFGFQGTIDFDPGPGVSNLTSSGSDFAICKYSPNGSFTWLRQFANTSTTVPGWIETDSENSILCVGYFYNTMDFDPGAGVFNLTSDGAGDVFVLKLNAQGNFTWCKQFRNSGIMNSVSLDVDAGDNIYLGGFFDSVMDIDPGPGTLNIPNTGGDDGFVVKLTKEGNYVWGGGIGGALGQSVDAVSFGTNGGVYLSISFYGSTDFDPGPGTNLITSFGDADIAVVKLTAAGSLEWVKQMGGTLPDGVRFLTLDNTDNIYITGIFSGTADFDPGPGVFGITSVGTYPYSDLFVAKYSLSNQITGNTFRDLNTDGVRQPNEPPLGNVMIKATRSGVDYFAISDTSGNYNVEADPGSYVITPHLPLYYTSIIPSNHTADFGTSYGKTDTANHFGLVVSTIIRDLRIFITALSPARAGRGVFYRLTYENIGTETISGNFTLTHDSDLFYVTASQVPANYTFPVITWNFSNLAASVSQSIDILFQVSTSVIQGDILKSYALINPVATDFNPFNNVDSVYQPVVASFDPNDKKVNPPGPITTGFISSGQHLDFTVRFQNTGNDTAFLVVIKDTISTNIDLESFEMLSASHPYILKFHPGRVIEWRFVNILLPDSNINEPRSHGLVRYRVKPKSNLVVGNEIRNKAAIYFDYNPPVITNETINIVTVVTGVNPDPALIGAKVFPNPTSSGLFIQLKGDFTYRVFDISGKTMWLRKNNRDEAFLDVSLFQKGIYFIELSSRKGRAIQKIVVH